MAQGKMRIGYAIMTKRGALASNMDGMYRIYSTKREASLELNYRVNCEIVRVTIDADA